MPSILAVFIGGGIGSVLRFLLGKMTLGLVGEFPIGTLVANVLATTVLAIAIGLIGTSNQTPSWVSAFLLTGFCGGFSTFSTFSLDTVKLFESGHLGMAIANILISVIACVIIAWIIVKK